jgi:cytosine/adenosine deaminase-related metal-dependent hydrolase
MPDDSTRFALQARIVFPVSAPPIADGCVTIENERIASVGPAAAGCPARDLGNVAIVPGFVNAHTHLEFSHLEAPLGRPGMPLVDWIELVMAHRRAAPQPTSMSVLGGLRECLSWGTTAVGEIATSDWRAAIAADEPLPDVVVFHESIAPTIDRVGGALSNAEMFLSDASKRQEIRAGLSPHAPYTVHRRLLASLVELGRRFNVPVAMHLAESREELQLLQTGQGPFRDLLADVNSWDPGVDARYSTIRDYLERLAAAPRALVIHGNYLSRDELELLSAHGATMSVVYCPRTHAYFAHEPYPLSRMLRMGVSVALGTDSRASNPDLSMLAEMQFVASHHPDVSPQTALELATLGGAKALGLDDEIGTLEPGKLANLAVIEPDGADRHDPYAMLLAPGARVVTTFLRGKAIDCRRGP